MKLCNFNLNFFVASLDSNFKNGMQHLKLKQSHLHVDLIFSL